MASSDRLPERRRGLRSVTVSLPSDLVGRLYERSGAARWGLARDRFEASLGASVSHNFRGRAPGAAEIEKYLNALHLDDFALAASCAAGLEPAWDHFVREHRPLLYRAADAIDPSGGARDLADALYGDLFGLQERAGVRHSLFHYFHGRSKLSTWLRAVLSQRHIDRVRAARRLAPIADEGPDAIAEKSSGATASPERARFASAMQTALAAALAALAPKDRLRLVMYYLHDVTLAAIGRQLREHEATVSRHLTRTRRRLRDDIEKRLRRDHGFDARAVAECFESVIEDAGALDLRGLVGTRAERKKAVADRSD